MGNPKDPKWSKITPTGNSCPPARWRHTATAWEQQVRTKRVELTLTSVRSDCSLTYVVRTTPPTPPPTPPATHHPPLHTQLLVFGGYTPHHNKKEQRVSTEEGDAKFKRYYEDLWLYDTANNKWSQPAKATTGRIVLG